ncbi:MAG: hypothetical protein FVQ81_09945 [Candidatus Glassbacteria bacterium]|nr:hypothetical protein [Candidatus Glassbacteria bacterium]
MHFLRGNQEHIQGRAVIFMDLKQPGDFGGEAGGMNALAVFCAVSELDLLELIVQVMHLPREHSRLITRFYRRYFEEIEKIKHSFPKRISRIIDEVVEDEEDEVGQQIIESFRQMFSRELKGEKAEDDDEAAAKDSREEDDTGRTGHKLPHPEFYSTMIPLPARDFIEACVAYQPEDGLDFDIIDLERAEMLEVAHLVLDAHSRLYVADFMNQKEREIELPDHKSYESPCKNYKQLSRDEFKRLLTELSSELMFLSETGRPSDRVFADLKAITSGSYLLREVVNLYNISTTQDPNKIKLMDLYFRKIFSLIDEDYMSAKEVQEEIQQFSP